MTAILTFIPFPSSLKWNDFKQTVNFVMKSDERKLKNAPTSISSTFT